MALTSSVIDSAGLARRPVPAMASFTLGMTHSCMVAVPRLVVPAAVVDATAAH